MVLWLQMCQPRVFLVMLHAHICKLHFLLSLNCSHHSLPDHTQDRCSSEAHRLHCPFSSKHVLADKEKHSLTQAVSWYRGLHWNFALLKCLPKNSGLGFYFMWHRDLSLTVTHTTGCSEPSSHLNQPNKDSSSQALDNAQAAADFKMGTVILMISQMIWKGNSLKGHWFVSLHL